MDIPIVNLLDLEKQSKYISDAFSDFCIFKPDIHDIATHTEACKYWEGFMTWLDQMILFYNMNPKYRDE